MPLSTDGMYSLGIEPPTILFSNDVAVARLLRHDVDDDVAVLAAAAGLAGELHVDLVDALAGGLAVRDLRLADVRLDLELAQQAVDDDLEVQLAHAGDDRLAGLLCPCGRGTSGPPRRASASAAAELVLLGLGLRLDRDVDDRVREHHRLEEHRSVLGAQRVAGRGVLQADSRDDVAGRDDVDVLAVVGVHLQQTADALLVALRRVQDVGAGVQRAGVDAEVGQLADERVGHDLERQRGERRLGVGRTLDLFVGLQVDALDGRRCRAATAGSRRPRRAAAGRPCS